jgi:hypothetical protein
VNISNFDNSNSTVAAIIDSFHKITISPTTGAYGVEANGIDSAGKITMTFTTSTPSGSGGYTCKMTMVKQ